MAKAVLFFHVYLNLKSHNQHSWHCPLGSCQIRASLEQFKEHIQINDVLCDWIENAPVDHVISKIDTKVVNKKYLKNMKYQLSLVYSKEDVRAIMDIIQEHVNIFLEQNPSASEENIKQCICEIGDFVQAGIENIDFHTLMQKIEELIGQKRKVYIIAIFRLCGINAQKLTRCQIFRFTLRVNFYIQSLLIVLTQIFLQTNALIIHHLSRFLADIAIMIILSRSPRH